MALAPGTPETCEDWISIDVRRLPTSLWKCYLKSKTNLLVPCSALPTTLYMRGLMASIYKCRTPLAGCGRMLGCRIRLHFHPLANASWFSDVWQRDDALGARWGCSSFSGQHAMRGGQTCFKQCNVTECNVHFSQRTSLHCQSWISSWRFLKLASLVLFRRLACASSVG